MKFEMTKLIVPILLPLGVYLMFGSVAAGGVMIGMSILYIVSWFV